MAYNRRLWKKHYISVIRYSLGKCITLTVLIDFSFTLRWSTSALPILNSTPNSWTSLRIRKPHSEFLNLTPNSQKTSLRIQKHHSEFKKLTPNSKTSLWIQKSYSEFLNFSPNCKISLRIQKHHSELKKTHSEFKNLTPNSKSALRIFDPHIHWGKSVVFCYFHLDCWQSVFLSIFSLKENGTRHGPNHPLSPSSLHVCVRDD